MALKLKRSPLPDRIDPPQPRRLWLWEAPDQYDAVYARNEAALLRLLQHPGQLVGFSDGGFCLMFNDPVMLDPAQTSALPLRRVGPDRYVSYPADEIPPRGLSIISQGVPKVLSLESATLVDPISLWDFSGISLVEGRSPPTSQIAIPKVDKSQKESTPRLSQDLQKIADKSEPFKDVRAHVAAAADRRLHPLGRATGEFTLRAFASGILIAIYAAVTVIVLGLGVRTGPVGLVIAMVVLLFLFGFFRLRTVDTVEGKGGEIPRQTRNGKQKSGGLLDRLRGLALWNTSLGNRLRRDIQRNLEQVNDMIDRGDIDRALKRAMSLAQTEQEKKTRKNRLMTAPPKPRATLDFDLNRDTENVVSIPGDWGFEDLRARYKTLAEDLSQKGDHRRAAFVYAELLDLIEPALLELEKMKAYEDAAKLATARGQNGATISRLWYLAEHKEIALLMARRHNCLEQLAIISEREPEFSVFVRMHWVEDLVVQGDLPRAVQESADSPQLGDTHLRVLGKAIGGGHLRDHPVLERAVQSLPWPIDALHDAPSEDTVGGQIAQVIRAGASEPDAGEIRSALKRAAERMDDSDPRKQALADAVVRASLAFDADTPFALSANDLRRFAKSQGCQALAEDLRQIHRAAPSKPQKHLSVPLPKSGHGDWTMVAAVLRGAALVGALTGDIALIDPQGVKRWADHLPDLVGMVPIGAGRFVLLLQGHDANRRISLLDVARHTYRALGSAKLVTWDHYAGDGVWHVQTPEAVGSLDLTKLLADTPSFEMLWSITQTIPVRVVAFRSTPAAVEWLTQRIEPHGPGLIEKWYLNRSSLRLSVNLEKQDKGNKLSHSPHVWCDSGFTRMASDGNAHETFQLHGPASNLEAEQALLAKVGDDLRLRATFAAVTAVPEGAAYAVEAPASDRSAIKMTVKNNRTSVRIEGHEILAQSASLNAEHLVLLTKGGLAILCNLKSPGVLAV